jgi:excisionase family DNA binding protein
MISAYIPNDDDTKLSLVSSRILAAHIHNKVRKLRFFEEDGSEQDAEIPAAAYQMLVDALTLMSQGNGVSLIPIQAELTTQEAADMLNVSRPFVIKLLETGEIPYRKVGTHRRIHLKDAIAYKQQIDTERSSALDELVKQSQELGLYD